MLSGLGVFPPRAASNLMQHPMIIRLTKCPRSDSFRPHSYELSRPSASHAHHRFTAYNDGLPLWGRKKKDEFIFARIPENFILGELVIRVNGCNKSCS